jgi:hypothetical protein
VTVHYGFSACVLLSALSTLPALAAPQAPVSSPTPMPSATPAATACATEPSSPALTVRLRQGYRDYRGLIPGEPARHCSLSMTPAKLLGAADGTMSTISLDFTDDGIRLTYAVSQPARPLASVGNNGITKGINVIGDDNLALFVRPRGAHHTLFIASVNPNGACVSFSHLNGKVLRHDECSAKRIPTASANAWSGQLTIPYTAIADTALGTDLDLRVQQMRHVEDPTTHRFLSTNHFLSGGSDLSGRTNADWTRVHLDIDDSARAESFVSAAGQAGHGTGILPHRIAVLSSLPIDSHSLLSAAFSDDSGPLLAKRDKTLKDIIRDKDLRRAFACVSCGSFESTNTTPFDPIVNSGDVLGIDFSTLGVDSVPFTFDAIGYALDSAYKGIFGDDTVGIAILNGTTSATFGAHDGVLRVARQFSSDADTLSVGLYHAAANRSGVPTPSPTALYAPAIRALANTSTTQLSLGYSHSVLKSAIGDPAFTTMPVRTYGALLRYGSQHTGFGTRFDIAASASYGPPVANFNRLPDTLPKWSAAFGYRNLGPAYAPLDGDFDPLRGLHGFYGEIVLANDKGKSAVTAFSLSGHRFSDALQERDKSVNTAATVRFGAGGKMGFALNYMYGRIAESQVARGADTPSFLPDALGGLTMLPNESLSPSLTYKNGTFTQASVGYTNGFSQNCDLTRASSPCYAYRQPGATATLLTFPFADVFVQAAAKRQDDQAVGLFNGVLTSGSGQQTTVGHIVREAALGAYLFNDRCSTLVLSTENRGGSIDNFAASPPQPGFTNTAALELQRRTLPASLLVAYARSATLGNAPSTQFLVRLRIGVPRAAYLSNVRRDCSTR